MNDRIDELLNIIASLVGHVRADNKGFHDVHAIVQAIKEALAERTELIIHGPLSLADVFDEVDAAVGEAFARGVDEQILNEAAEIPPEVFEDPTPSAGVSTESTGESAGEVGDDEG
jgi:hypothetical protein